MPTAIHSARPKVLFIGSSCGVPEKDDLIRQVAEVHVLPGKDYASTIPLVKAVVEEHGPFDAFGVSFLVYGLGGVDQTSPT
jgi:hypothetical protein